MAKTVFRIGDIVVLAYVTSPKMTVVDVADDQSTVTVGWFDHHDDYHTATHKQDAVELDQHTLECKRMLKAREEQELASAR